MHRTGTVPTSRRYLLVEDNPDHAELLKLAFVETESDWTLAHVTDGEAAIEYIHHGDPTRNGPAADVILLDLKLPGLSGHEVLDRLKSDPLTKSIPVIILTTSSSDEDRSKAFMLHANSYIVKPLDFTDFNAMVRDLDEFWTHWHACTP